MCIYVNLINLLCNYVRTRIKHIIQKKKKELFNIRNPPKHKQLSLLDIWAYISFQPVQITSLTPSNLNLRLPKVLNVLMLNIF